MADRDQTGEAPVQITTLPQDFITAPDGSEIREIVSGGRTSMVHCTLPKGGVSLAVRHRTVEELWFVVSGRGEVWRAFDGREEVVAVGPGAGLDIPLGAHFQFRNTGAAPLVIVIATMPSWPGGDEAPRVPGRWPTGGAAP